MFSRTVVSKAKTKAIEANAKAKGLEPRPGPKTLMSRSRPRPLLFILEDEAKPSRTQHCTVHTARRATATKKLRSRTVSVHPALVCWNSLAMFIKAIHYQGNWVDVNGQLAPSRVVLPRGEYKTILTVVILIVIQHPRIWKATKNHFILGSLQNLSSLQPMCKISSESVYNCKLANIV